MRFSSKLILAAVFFFLLAVTTVLINVGGIDSAKKVSGQSSTVSVDLCGFAWGATNEDNNPNDGTDTGIGWLSFNSKDCDANGDGTSDNPLCPQPRDANGQPIPIPSYKVTMSGDGGGSLGSLTGSAWSPNIGWVKFGGLSASEMPNSFGTGQGTWQDNAQVVNYNGTLGSDFRNSSELRGWARACAGTNGGADGFTGGNCTGANRTDGWQGFISLSNAGGQGVGNPPPPPTGTYRVSVNNGIFSGYSWDPYVSGWLNWGGRPDGVRFCGTELPDFGIQADPSAINVLPATTISKDVEIKISRLPGEDFPNGSVSLSVSNPADGSVSADFVNNSSCSENDLPCTRILRITSPPVGLSDDERRTITVTGTAGSSGTTISHSATVTVVAGAVAGALNVVCPMPASHDQSAPPIPGIYYVNQPVVWRADVSGVNGYEPTGNLVFTTTLDQPFTQQTSEQNGVFTGFFTKSYSTLGRKTFSASVMDGAVPAPAQGECGPIEIVVGVNPNIIER